MAATAARRLASTRLSTLSCTSELHPLRGARRKRPPPLHVGEHFGPDLARAQRAGEPVRRRDRILDGEIDADAADRRHRMRRVADAQEARPVPLPQPVDLHGQELDVVPAPQFRARDPASSGASSTIAARKASRPALLDLIVSALRDDVGALPVVAAIEHHEDLAGADAPERFLAVARLARQPHPQDIDRRAEIVDHKAGALAHGRMAAVGADDERRRGSSSRPSGVFARKPTTAAILLDQFGRFGLHAQIETRIARALLGQEIEEIPLRHERDEFAARRQMGEIGDLHAGRRRSTPRRCAHFLVRQLEEFLAADRARA